MKFKVTGPYQVNHDGKNYVKGDTFEVSESDAREWVTAGFGVEVKESAPKESAPKKSGK